MSEKHLYFSLIFDGQNFVAVVPFLFQSLYPWDSFPIVYSGERVLFLFIVLGTQQILGCFFFLLSDIFLFHFSDHFLSYFFLEFLLVTYQNSQIDSTTFFNFDSIFHLLIFYSHLLGNFFNSIFQTNIEFFFSDFIYSFTFQELFLFFKSSLYIVL